MTQIDADKNTVSICVEPSQYAAPVPAEKVRIEEWVICDSLDGIEYLRAKPVAESRLPLFVPIVGLRHILLGRESDRDLVAQRRRVSSEALACCHDS